MGAIPLEHGLAVAGILFCLGLVGLMVRRNILFVLMSLEVMMNAAALAFIVAGARWVQPDGQVMFILVISLAAAEASIGLAILLQLYRRFHTSTSMLPVRCADEPYLPDFRLPLIGFLLLSFSRGRFSENLSALIGVGSVGLSAAVAAYVIWQFNVAPPEGGAYSQLLWQWMSVDGFAPNFTLYVDGLSITMLGVVTGVGFLIHLFASGTCVAKPVTRASSRTPTCSSPACCS